LASASVRRLRSEAIRDCRQRRSKPLYASRPRS
jgi:hypothetical protein